MPALNEIERKIGESSKQIAQVIDATRLEALSKLSAFTGRNTIAYYSCWLLRGVPGHDINDLDIDGFMNVIHGMDRKKGLDLILHTPGGGIAATEQIVHYLRSIFGADIRCIVPQLAMSAGTMIACSSREIIMGRQSCLGPIDPQFYNLPCHGVVEEFESAKKEVADNPAYLGVWQPIIGKYNPTFVGECKKAMALSENLVKQWLSSGMFVGEKDSAARARKAVKALSDHAATKTHNRHLPAEAIKKIGLKVSMMEDNDQFQDLILTVHHTFMLTLIKSKIVKIMESDVGKMFVINGQ